MNSIVISISIIVCLIFIVYIYTLDTPDIDASDREKRDALYQEGIRWYNEQMSLPKFAIQFTTVNQDVLVTSPYNPDYHVTYYRVEKYTSLEAATEAMNSSRRLTSHDGIHVDINKVVLMQLVEIPLTATLT